MDLLQRLIAGSGAANAKQKTNTPNERLAACKRICNTLQAVWRNGTSLGEDDGASDHVTSQLRRLNLILTEESRKAAPHSCLIYIASAQVYIIVAKLALSSTSPQVIDTSTQFFHILINGEAEGLLDSKIFARSLADLVRRSTSPASIVVDAQGETALIELLFEIATKIRLDPDILPAWFYPERGPGTTRASHSDARRGQFPLFYILVDYVHYDGAIGDFARTALLYLTETAPKSRPLEKWMLESDLAPQMASGLSALYSRLSRRQLMLSKEALPILAYSDVAEAQLESPDFIDEANQNMRAFLSYLAFWQDALNHCKSLEVRDTLLDHFQVLFVQQLLYPSLLESSDVAGGSTAAVILHLCRIIDAIEHPQLINRMLCYLFAARAESGPKDARARARMSMSRRKSMEQLATLAKLADNPSPELFNLLDLICYSLQSANSQTVQSSIRLISTILNRHHYHVANQLFSLRKAAGERRQNLNDLNNVMMTFFDLANAISATENLDSSYEAALKDAQLLLERHSCLVEAGKHEEPPMFDFSGSVVTQDGKVFRSMIDLLNLWFANDTVVNLELTGAFTSLAACQHISMREWLSPLNEDLGTYGQQISVAKVLQSLIEQVKSWRNQFVEWDAFYSIQRVDLSAEDEGAPPRPSSPISIQDKARTRKENSPQGTPTSKPRKLAEIGSIDSRIASPKPMGSPLTKDFPQSPMQQAILPQDNLENESRRSISSNSLSTTLLQTQIPLGIRNNDTAAEDRTDEDVEQERKTALSILTSTEGESGTATPLTQDQGGKESASLRHILTQAVILQEFILELAAILQIRATLFDEVDLS